MRLSVHAGVLISKHQAKFSKHVENKMYASTLIYLYMSFLHTFYTDALIKYMHAVHCHVDVLLHADPIRGHMLREVSWGQYLMYTM